MFGCIKDKKVPTLEREFITDQRTQRKMFIGASDPTNSNLHQRLEARKRKSEMRMCDLRDKTDEEYKRLRLVSICTDDSSVTSASDDEFKPPATSFAII